MNSSTLSLPFSKLIALAAILLWSGSLAVGQSNDESPFPALEDFPENEIIPDPFMRPDGTRVGSRSEWKQQRLYLRSMVEHYLYGGIPPKPLAKDVSVEKFSDKAWQAPGSEVEGRKLSYRITISSNGLDHSFGFILCRPTKIMRYPTVILNNYASLKRSDSDFRNEEFLAIFDFADEYFFDKPKGPSSYNAAPKSDTWRYDPGLHPLQVDWEVPRTRLNQ